MPLFDVTSLRFAAQQELRKAGPARTAAQQLSEAVRAQNRRDTFDIFLSHSFADAELILGLRNAITEMGFSVYVDWLEDPSLDRNNITSQTATILRARMRQSASLLFATSDAAAKSRWMPWELGYFDGYRGRVAIVPVSASSAPGDHFEGREYLGLYPYVTAGIASNTGRQTLWIHDSERKWVDIRSWLKGSSPR